MSAELIFPILVYITIYANIDLFYENLKFIQRFSKNSDLMGIEGYIITNFKAVHYFIENINGSELL